MSTLHADSETPSIDPLLPVGQPARVVARSGPRELWRWLFVNRFTVVVLAGPAVLRLWAASRGESARFPDSTGWLSPGAWSRSNRYGPVPFVLDLVESDSGRVLLQALIGAVSWSILALVASRWSRRPRAAMLAVMIVSLLPQVIRYDVALLSESLGISFAVLAVAATLTVIADASVRGWMSWVGAVMLCGLTRPLHLLVIVVAAVAMALVAARSRRGVHVLAAGLLFAGLILGLVLLHGNRSTSELNIYTVLASDVMTDDARYEWFVEQGMPEVEGIREADGYEDPALLPPRQAEELALPAGQLAPSLVRVGGLEYQRWVQAAGQGTYVRYLFSHPGDTLARLHDLASPALSPQTDDFLPLDSFQLLPHRLFGPWQLWMALVVAGCAGAALRKMWRHTIILVGMGATVASLFAGSMLLSGLEHVRHGATSAVLVRVLGVVAVTLATGRSTPMGVVEATSSGRVDAGSCSSREAMEPNAGLEHLRDA